MSSSEAVFKAQVHVDWGSKDSRTSRPERLRPGISRHALLSFHHIACLSHAHPTCSTVSRCALIHFWRTFLKHDSPARYPLDDLGPESVTRPSRVPRCRRTSEVIDNSMQSRSISARPAWKRRRAIFLSSAFASRSSTPFPGPRQALNHIRRYDVDDPAELSWL
jgi:hypothetical protein